MSMDRTVYLGPFLKCKPNPMTIRRTFRVCPECGDSKGLVYNFCPIHGKSEEITVEEPADASQFIHDIVEIGFKHSLFILAVCGAPVIDGFVCLAPNKRTANDKRRYSLDPECPDEYAIEIEPGDRGDEMFHFSQAFAGEIAELKNICVSVEIKWGLIFTVT